MLPAPAPYCHIFPTAPFRNTMYESLAPSPFMYVGLVCFRLRFTLFWHYMPQALETVFSHFYLTSFPYKMTSSFSSVQYCNWLARHFTYFSVIFLYKNPAYPNKYLSTNPERRSHSFFYWNCIERRQDFVFGWVYKLFFGKVGSGAESKRCWLFDLKLGDIIKFIRRQSSYTQKYNLG